MTDAQRAKLTARLAAVGLSGCSDGGCILVTPDGQHTNGGCQHVKGRTGEAETRRDLQRLAMVLRQYVEEDRPPWQESNEQPPQGHW